MREKGEGFRSKSHLCSPLLATACRGNGMLCPLDQTCLFAPNWCNVAQARCPRRWNWRCVQHLDLHPLTPGHSTRSATSWTGVAFNPHTPDFLSSAKPESSRQTEHATCGGLLHFAVASTLPRVRCTDHVFFESERGKTERQCIKRTTFDPCSPFVSTIPHHIASEGVVPPAAVGDNVFANDFAAVHAKSFLHLRFHACATWAWVDSGALCAWVLTKLRLTNVHPLLQQGPLIWRVLPHQRLLDRFSPSAPSLF